MEARRSAIQTDFDAWAALREKEGLEPTSRVYRKPERRPFTKGEVRTR